MFEVDQRRIIDRNFDQHKQNIMKSIVTIATTEPYTKKVSCNGLEY